MCQSGELRSLEIQAKNKKEVIRAKGAISFCCVPKFV
jgi:hypothetical protein